jgi:hypothetical protein
MTDRTRVIFRVYPNGDVLAIMPDTNDHWDQVSCYQHMGQHGHGVYSVMMSTTRPATPEEYAPLLRELESIGYRVDVRKRYNWG